MITNESEYNKAMDDIVRLALTNPRADTPDGLTMERLCREVEQYAWSKRIDGISRWAFPDNFGEFML